jgi:hypothetical protein
LASEHGVAITVSRSRGPKHSFDRLIADLAELTKQPASAVVMELSGDVRHWTVLRRLGKHSLELFDSSGMERVKLASCWQQSLRNWARLLLPGGKRAISARLLCLAHVAGDAARSAEASSGVGNAPFGTFRRGCST